MTENVFQNQLMAIEWDVNNVSVDKCCDIRVFERRLNKPLQWLTDILLMIQLAFRYLFSILDVLTSGPKASAVEIRIALENCEENHLSNFKIIMSKKSQN